jgi:2-oxoglutarate ferredoxin oxidoreductase subunit alpha
MKVIGEKVQFVSGDDAVCYGALLAGCTFFAGYPITPATEIAEGMARLLPKIGGIYMQMEDEISSLAACIGASWTGRKCLTATSGPGFSLMQENIGYACMTETPLVIVNVMRSGPSTGQPTLAAQGDIMQARFGTHGDHEIIALYPNSVQESLDLAIQAFNLSEKYRVPVILLLDAEIAHMREKLVIPDDFLIINRVLVTIDTKEYHPFRTGFTHPGSKVPEFAPFGSGYHTYVTGLTHEEHGFPSTTDPHAHDRLVRRLSEKILDDEEALSYLETRFCEDAETFLITYGITSRTALAAVKNARQKGKKVGYVRLKTIWPFPKKTLQHILHDAHDVIVAEMNLGQLIMPVREIFGGARNITKVGGEIFLPEEMERVM